MQKKLSEKNISIKENLKKLRKIEGLTLLEFSEKVKINLETLKSYETDQNVPSLEKILAITNFFGISIDFFIHWEITDYIKNIDFILLAQKIDGTNLKTVNRVEGAVCLFLDNIRENKVIKDHYDSDLKLTESINENIEILRKNRELTQKNLADYLDVNPSQISHYQKKSIPPMDKLAKLSEIFDISMHTVATGNQFDYDFKNRDFGKNILMAERLLPLEHQKILMVLMRAGFKNR